jgi:hypothetical protein
MKSSIPQNFGLHGSDTGNERIHQTGIGREITAKGGVLALAAGRRLLLN